MRRRAFLKTGIGATLALAGLAESRPLSAGPTPSYKILAPGLAADSESLPLPRPEPTTLKGWADLLGIRIGGPVIAGNPAFRDAVTSEFNLGNVYGGWNEPTRGAPKYFAMNDASLARRLGLPTFFISILDPVQVPTWVRNGSFSKNELRDIIKSRVEGMMTAGTGLIDEWVVVSEPNKPNDFFWNTFGPDYIDYAHQVAREFADRNLPGAKLIYMDFGNITDSGLTSQRLEQALTISERLRRHGLLDKMAVEGDILYTLGIPDKDAIIRTLKRYNLPIIMCEVAVMMHGVPGSQAERFAKQAEVYRMLLTAALESGVCDEFIVPQGVDNLTYWDTQPPPTGYPDNDATPFDDDMSKKPAYYAMRDVLMRTAVARGLYTPAH